MLKEIQIRTLSGALGNLRLLNYSIFFGEQDIKADMVDQFQGQENEIIIPSTGDNEISEFSGRSNRLNAVV